MRRDQERTLCAGYTGWGTQATSQAGVLLFGSLCSKRGVKFCIVCMSQGTEWKFPLEQGQDDKTDVKEGLLRRMALRILGFRRRKMSQGVGNGTQIVFPIGHCLCSCSDPWWWLNITRSQWLG